MSSRWVTTFITFAMATYSSAQTPMVSLTDSRGDVSPNDGERIGHDGKPTEPCNWRPNFQPVNNIQIERCSSDTAATDDLLNLTRTILDILQNRNREQPQDPVPISIASYPRDCSEIQAGGVNTSGMYSINPNGPGDPFFVSCDMETDGGGWTVFQRREDGSVDFYLDWSDYKYGFGSVSAEHWLGNDKIHRLTTQSQKNYELRVDLEDFEGETRYARYNYFSIADEDAGYGLATGVYSGDAGDSITSHTGESFATRDRDGDCAVAYTGAWWYESCHSSNLNGQYLNGTTTEYAKGVVWQTWLGYYYSLKKTEMKIRPV